MGTEDKRIYLAIDLKSFYASVECVERGLDPLRTNLVVADNSRTEKTICLALTPSLKAYGIKGRPRLFEVVQKIREVNAQRRQDLRGRDFSGTSYLRDELLADHSLEVDYLTARPRMAHYIDYSTRIYNIYLKYVAAEDIHVYSIDEVFIDLTAYLSTYKMTAYQLTQQILLEVLAETGVTATAGIGTNLYLAKIAMDIMAKKIVSDEKGVQIAELDEMSYRQALWSHRPLTDFWRLGPGYARKLEKENLYTMGDIARCSLGGEEDYYNEELLYQMFGINAELLIDHAWGYEPVKIADIKAYKPASKSIGSGQVLHRPHSYEQAKLIVWEMTDLLVLDLVSKRLLTNQIVLRLGYDRENLLDADIREEYEGEISLDAYGRERPKSAHGRTKLRGHSSSTREIIEAVMELFDRIVDPRLLIRRVTLSANNIVDEGSRAKDNEVKQLDLFADFADPAEQRTEEEKLAKERRVQEAIIKIKDKYGKNAIVKGSNLKEGATTMDRNRQIGGHKA